MAAVAPRTHCGGTGEKFPEPRGSPSPPAIVGGRRGGGRPPVAGAGSSLPAQRLRPSTLATRSSGPTPRLQRLQRRPAPRRPFAGDHPPTSKPRDQSGHGRSPCRSRSATLSLSPLPPPTRVLDHTIHTLSPAERSAAAVPGGGERDWRPGAGRRIFATHCLLSESVKGSGSLHPEVQAGLWDAMVGRAPWTRSRCLWDPAAPLPCSHNSGARPCFS